MTIDKDSFERIIENLHDGLYIVDANRTILYWNKAAERISGFSADEVVGKSCADNILTHIDSEGNSLCTGDCPLLATINDGKPRESVVYMHHKNGHRIPVSVRASNLTDSKNNTIGGIEIFTDVSNQEINELRLKELEQLALLDNLTRLANRNYIEKELQNRLAENKRHDTSFGVLFIDIDYFKKINDTFGHKVGDDVLKFIAKIFIANARTYDFYGRWGGEEFIGLVRNVNNKELDLLGNRLRILVENSYIIHDDTKISVTISMGGTLIQKDDTIESLINRADILLYNSKSAGRNHLTIG